MLLIPPPPPPPPPVASPLTRGPLRFKACVRLLTDTYCRARAVHTFPFSRIRRNKLTWPTRWNATEILWINLTYPCGREPVQSIWEGDSKAIGRTFCLSQPSGPIRFFTTSQDAKAQGFPLVPGETLAVCQCPVASRWC